MKQTEVDWKSGHVVHWDLEWDEIEDDVPLRQQCAHLHEDMAMVGYSREHALDVGWYPAHSARGTLTVRVIHGPFGEELLRLRALTMRDFREQLRRAIEFADTWSGRPRRRRRTE